MKKLLIVLTMTVMIISGCNPNGNNTVPTSTPYPEEVPWELAVDILNRGEVDTVNQLHNLTVTLLLNDGTEIKTIEPVIDAIFEEVDKCGQPCDNIALATE